MNSIIGPSLILFINIAYTHLLLTRKRSIKYASFIFIINFLVVLFGVVLSHIFLKDSIFYKYITVSLVFSFIVYIFLVFEESISKKIFTMFTIWVFSSAILILSSHIISFFQIKEVNSYKFYLVYLRAFIQLIFFPITCIYFRPYYKAMLKLVSTKVINLISFYSILVFSFLFNYYEVDYYKPINYNALFNSLLLISIIILSYVIIFIAIWSVNKNMELEYKFKIIDTQIEAKNYIAASKYMGEVTENEVYQNVGILCENFTIDSILKYYRHIAIRQNMDFMVNVNIPEDINIDNLDLSIVIGNCVENSMEACNNILDKSKKYINITSEIKGFNLVLKIINSFNGQVKEEDSIIKTSKDGEGHGIGLSNVRKITEKYNGFFEAKYTDSEFEVSIIMNFN